MRHRIPVLFASSMVVLVPDQRAEACSCYQPFHERSVYPSDGATNLPLNVRFVVSYGTAFAEDEVRSQLRLRYADGADIPTAVFQLESFKGAMVVAKEPLDAGREIELLGRDIVEPCLEANESCYGEAMVVLGRYQLGEQEDHTPPAFDEGVVTTSRSHRQCGEGCSCDFDYSIGLASISWPGAHDESGWAPLYNYYVDGQLAASYRQSSTARSYRVYAGLACEAGVTGNIGFYAGDYEIEAIDIAGNRSRHPIRSPLPTAEPPEEEGGCAVGAAPRQRHAPRAALALWLGACLALRRRRP